MTSIFDHLLELVVVIAIILTIAFVCMSIMVIFICTAVFLANILGTRNYFHRTRYAYDNPLPEYGMQERDLDNEYVQVLRDAQVSKGIGDEIETRETEA